MTDLLSVASALERFFAEQRWDFCIIGGMATLHWGEPRATRDVDVTLLTGFGGEERYVAKLLEHYTARIPDAAAFALRNRVLLVQDSSGVGIDVALGALPFEQSAVARSVPVKVSNEVTLRLCTAEDLIVFKSFAARAIDWRDVESVVARQGKNRLDWEYIDRQLLPLVEAKEDPEILRTLDRIRKQAG